LAKDAYYFSHDSNAKDDPKCVLLIEQLGLEGYGIFWVLIETLRDQPEYKYPVNLIPALARRYNTTAEKVKTVIHSYGLFTIDEQDFFSLSLMRRMEHMDYKREIARLAGKKSAEKRLLTSNNSTDVQPTFNQCSTSKVKESKVNESIENNNSGTSPHKNTFKPPTLEEVQAYCKERNNKVDAERWYDFYSSKGWMIGKNKMKDWKAAVRTWEKSGQATQLQKGKITNFTERVYDGKALEEAWLKNRKNDGL
jgi:hypothetical protein